MMPYSNWWSLIWEILFFGSILTIFVEELYEVAKGLGCFQKRPLPRGLIEARSNGRCRCMQFLRRLGLWEWNRNGIKAGFG